MTLLIVAIVFGSIFVYGAAAGATYHLAHKYLDWDDDLGEGVAGLFWPVMLFPILVRVTAREYIPAAKKMLKESQARRAEMKALPPIQIKPGAKLDSMADYQRLKKLVTDFEIENGFDRLLEE